MAKFGWCMDGHHKECPAKRQRWYFGSKREGRKTVEAIIFMDDFWECDCKCHGK